MMGCKHKHITCGNLMPLLPGLPKPTPWRLRDKLKMVNGIPAAHFAWVYNRLNSYVLSHSTPFSAVYHDSPFTLYLRCVYKAGFARTQAAYEATVNPVFQSLDRLEKILEGREYLIGNRLTEADVRLYVFSDH